MIERKTRGTFIAFEGIDGSGKSTQMRLLSERLREKEVPFYTTMEPTDAPIGSLIRQIMTGRIKTDNKAIAALFVADRFDHLLNDVNGILHKIEDGTAVIMDRYYFSSYAYQSVDVPMDWVIQANGPISGILKPTVNLFLDIDPDTALERIAKNRFRTELFEDRERLVRVRQQYMEAFEKLHGTEHVVIIDGNRSEDAVAADVWDAVKSYFE